MASRNAPAAKAANDEPVELTEEDAAAVVSALTSFPFAPAAAPIETPPALSHDAKVVVDEDCTAAYNGVVVSLKKGQRLDGPLAAWLAETGAAVTLVDEA